MATANCTSPYKLVPLSLSLLLWHSCSLHQPRFEQTIVSISQICKSKTSTWSPPLNHPSSPGWPYSSLETHLRHPVSQEAFQSSFLQTSSPHPCWVPLLFHWWAFSGPDHLYLSFITVLVLGSLSIHSACYSVCTLNSLKVGSCPLSVIPTNSTSPHK